MEQSGQDFSNNFVREIEQANWPKVSEGGRGLNFGDQGKEVGIGGFIELIRVEELLHCLDHRRTHDVPCGCEEGA